MNATAEADVPRNSFICNAASGVCEKGGEWQLGVSLPSTMTQAKLEVSTVADAKVRRLAMSHGTTSGNSHLDGLP